MIGGLKAIFIKEERVIKVFIFVRISFASSSFCHWSLTERATISRYEANSHETCQWFAGPHGAHAGSGIAHGNDCGEHRLAF